MSKSYLKKKSKITENDTIQAWQWLWKINGFQNSIFRHLQEVIKFNSQSLLFFKRVTFCYKVATFWLLAKIKLIPCLFCKQQM
jgi:hypothetical protein